METTRKLPHPSFFHYEKPSTEDMQRARTVNMQSGKDQPCGKFNLERFQNKKMIHVFNFALKANPFLPKKKCRI